MQKHVSELFAERLPAYRTASLYDRQLVDLGSAATLTMLQFDLEEILASNRFSQEQALRSLLDRVKFLLEDA